jgi:glycerol kinase
VWKDTRTVKVVDEILQKLNVDQDHFRHSTGLPISSFAPALKIRWLNQLPAVKEAQRENVCLAGTIDTWIVWNLIRGLHVTDCTNASRTLLMNITTLNWDPTLLHAFSIDEKILPEIKSSSEIYGGKINDGSELDGLTISAIIGNQQACLLGQSCFKVGEAKSTYRSGCFLLCNIGKKPIFSHHGLVTTVAYKFGKSKPIYALEGNIAIGGAALKWLKDNLGLIKDANESEVLGNSVSTTGDCYFVPAFQGLFAPYYQKEARG